MHRNCALGRIAPRRRDTRASTRQFGFVRILFIGKQCNLQNLIDMINKDNFKIFQDIGWNIRQVLFIILRNNDFPDISTMGGEQLLLSDSGRTAISPQLQARS